MCLLLTNIQKNFHFKTTTEKLYFDNKSNYHIKLKIQQQKLKIYFEENKKKNLKTIIITLLKERKKEKI